MNKDNDFVTNFQKASIDWYNSTDNNDHPIKSNNNGHSTKSNNSIRFSYGARRSLFAIIVLILFIIAFSHYVRTGTFIDFSFKTFIEYLSNMPDISLEFASIDVTSYSDWGIFTFFKSIWNYAFAPLIEFVITIVGMISQAFTVIYYLVSMLFL